MPTFITVIQFSDGDQNYTAVQGCINKNALDSYTYYNSQYSQEIPSSRADMDLGTKSIINIKNGNKTTGRVFQLLNDVVIDSTIKVPGCDAAVKFNFHPDVASLIESHNLVAKERVKLFKYRQKLKNS